MYPKSLSAALLEFFDSGPSVSNVRLRISPEPPAAVYSVRVDFDYRFRTEFLEPRDAQRLVAGDWKRPHLTADVTILAVDADTTTRIESFEGPGAGWLGSVALTTTGTKTVVNDVPGDALDEDKLFIGGAPGIVVVLGREDELQAQVDLYEWVETNVGPWDISAVNRVKIGTAFSPVLAGKDFFELPLPTVIE